jgi:hypothetical protein
MSMYRSNVKVGPWTPLSTNKEHREAELACYREALRLLKKAGIDVLIGGAFGLWKYTDVRRPTKDLDLFLRPNDLPSALHTLEVAGYRTEITASHWLGKATHKDFLIDFIVGMANGLSQVDDSWFRYAVKDLCFGMPVKFLSPEDMIWSKAFVMARERFDGADIAHLLHARGRQLDWNRLVRRSAGHEAVLLSHLLLFRHIYPGDKSAVPVRVMQRLWKTAIRQWKRDQQYAELCRGPLFSRDQYAIDIGRRGFHDARLLPYGSLTPRQVLE